MKRQLTLLVLLMMIASVSFSGKYVQDIASKSGDPSPVGITGSSTNQFGKASGLMYANGRIVGGGVMMLEDSMVDNYINQDEQINLDKDAGIVKVLRVNQKNLVNDYTSTLIKFDKAVPRELRGVARDIARIEGGDADVFRDKVTGDNWLHIICPEFQLPYLQEAFKMLDEPWISEYDDGSQLLYYNTKFRAAEDVNFAARAWANDVSERIVDTQNNAILCFEQQGTIGLVKDAFNKMDIPPSQITLEAKVYEVDVTNDHKVGLDWVAWKNGPGQFLFRYVYDNSQGMTNPDMWKYHSYNFIVNSSFIDFMTSKGRAKLLTQGTITTKSGRYGELATVEEVLAFHSENSGTTLPIAPYDPNEDPTVDLATNHIRAYDMRMLNYNKGGEVGVWLGIMPYIGTETTEMGIALHVSDVVGFQNNGAPIVEDRAIDSYVRIKDGQPFMLGGLKRRSSVETSNRIPFLGDLPVIGWLFGGEQVTKRETMLVAILTPHMSTSTASKTIMPEHCKTLVAQVDGEADLMLPDNRFGFDQWLLDND